MTYRKNLVLALTLLAGTIAPKCKAAVLLAKNGVAQSAIYVAPRVMAADKALKDPKFMDTENEENRQRLRESVKDLALYLGKMSGATVPILQRAPQKGDKCTPILVGELATQKFGPVQRRSAFQQGWRLTVGGKGVGVQGESDESASFAIYEILDRLGCHWFMPGEIGESVPRAATLQLAESDVSSVPSCLSRTITYPDPKDPFCRRNRLTKASIKAEHALEFYITPEQRKQHPDWCAIVDGKPSAKRLKWSNPEVAAAVADAIIARLDKDYRPSMSISPDDGVGFDESAEDKALDAGDWDSTMNQVSITDRYIVLCNRIAERVTKKYPDERLGFLAYVQYTRPPVREKLHPNLVPEIAPITYCRAHAMTDAQVCPSRAQLRSIVEGWAKVAPEVAYYNYMYNLAEPSVPYPMMHQMKEELPLLFQNKVTYWQPETMPTHDSSLPGLWLSMRMAWNKDQSPDQILDEFVTRFYGKAATPMRAYWQALDDAWTNNPAHAGGMWSYTRRFTPAVLAAARVSMNEALQAAATPLEYRRVQMQERALRQFERFMQMRFNLNEGRLANLGRETDVWYGTQAGLGDEYESSGAFGMTYWALDTAAAHYFKYFNEQTYRDAARIARQYSVLSKPLRQWKYAYLEKDPKASDSVLETVARGEKTGWQNADFDDKAWKTTDTGIDSWADLGLLDHYGTMWYRLTTKVPAVPAGKKVYLWLSATDGSARVYVNGKAIPYLDSKGEKSDFASGYATPFSFDITEAVKPGADNQITVAGTRLEINELGTGGLMGPAYIYADK